MALFGGRKLEKPEKTETYTMAEQVLAQTEAFCNGVLSYVDGTTDAEKRMRTEVNQKLANAQGLKDALEEGRLDPQMCITLGFSITYSQLVEIVTKLDASTPEEEAFIDAAHRQLEVAAQAGYAPALELQRQGVL